MSAAAASPGRGSQGGAVSAPPPATCLYVCGNCLQEHEMDLKEAIMCKFCAHDRGTSKIFFKKRLVSTVYDTK